MEQLARMHICATLNALCYHICYHCIIVIFIAYMVKNPFNNSNNETCYFVGKQGAVPAKQFLPHMVLTYLSTIINILFPTM